MNQQKIYFYFVSFFCYVLLAIIELIKKQIIQY